MAHAEHYLDTVLKVTITFCQKTPYLRWSYATEPWLCSLVERLCRVTLMFSEGCQRQTNAVVHPQKKMVEVFNTYMYTYTNIHTYMHNA